MLFLVSALFTIWFVQVNHILVTSKKKKVQFFHPFYLRKWRQLGAMLAYNFHAMYFHRFAPVVRAIADFHFHTQHTPR